MARALRSFPADTAPGPSGLRVQHQGQVCPAIAPVLAGAGLVAVPKPNGGVRPIAVGEILRRLTGKYLMQTVQEDARRAFWPTQLGVGIKSGAEIGIHTVRAWTQRNGTAANKVLKLDFAISRHHVLESATVQFPGLARWVTWCWSLLPCALGLLSSRHLVGATGRPLGTIVVCYSHSPTHSRTLSRAAGPRSFLFGRWHHRGGCGSRWCCFGPYSIAWRCLGPGFERRQMRGGCSWRAPTR